MLRPLTEADLPAAFALTQRIGWSHQLHDWSLHWRLGQGFALCDDDGRLIGTIMRWPYGEHYGTVGLVIVDPDQQGRGHGRRLMDAILASAGGRTLGLAATDAGIRLYEQTGFVRTGQIEQWQGTVAPVTAAEVAAAAPSGLAIRPMGAADLSTVIDLDARATGAPRDALLHAVWQVAVGGWVAERSGGIVGFTMVRAAGHGHTVGPLIAPDEPAAAALATRALANLTGIARLDIPAEATLLGTGLARVGLRCVDRVTLMRRGPAPATDPTARCFGLASQALG
ncbi:MAG: GNAT family N-acetyltransferase [Steroidobacteraceae bacterium]